MVVLVKIGIETIGALFMSNWVDERNGEIRQPDIREDAANTKGIRKNMERFFNRRETNRILRVRETKDVVRCPYAEAIRFHSFQFIRAVKEIEAREVTNDKLSRITAIIP